MRPYATSACGLTLLVVQAREPRITVGDLMAEMGLSSLDQLMDSVSVPLTEDSANGSLSNSNSSHSNSSARQERGLAKALASATAAAWRGVDPLNYSC